MPGRRAWPRSRPRHGLAPAEVLKFDQNTPPLPGVAQIPLAESFATLNQYPPGAYRELREAAAAYVSGDEEAAPRRLGADRHRRGCRRPHPALRAHVPGARAQRVDRLADVCPLPDRHDARRAPIPSPALKAPRVSLLWRCNPDNPTGVDDPGARSSSSSPDGIPRAAVVVDEAYIEYGGEIGRPVARGVPQSRSSCGRCPRPSATPRCVSAMRSPHPRLPRCSRPGARRRRSRRPRPASPRRRFGEPRYDLAPEIAERERVRDRPRCRRATTRRPVRAISSGSEPRTTSPIGSRSRASSCAGSRRGSG